MPADIDVQQAVVVHVDKSHPLLPDGGIGAFVADSGSLRHVFELEVAKIAEEAAAFGLAHDKNVRQPVAVVVPDGDPCADRTIFELLIKVSPHPGIVETILRSHAGFFGRELHKHGFPAGEKVRCQRLLGDTARGVRRPGSRTGNQRCRQDGAAQPMQCRSASDWEPRRLRFGFTSETRRERRVSMKDAG